MGSGAGGTVFIIIIIKVLIYLYYISYIIRHSRVQVVNFIYSCNHHRYHFSILCAHREVLQLVLVQRPDDLFSPCIIFIYMLYTSIIRVSGAQIRYGNNNDIIITTRKERKKLKEE